MAKGKTIFKDKAGNKLILTRLKAKIQLSAKNRQGKLVTRKDLETLFKRAKRAKKI